MGFQLFLIAVDLLDVLLHASLIQFKKNEDEKESNLCLCCKRKRVKFRSELNHVQTVVEQQQYESSMSKIFWFKLKTTLLFDLGSIVSVLWVCHKFLTEEGDIFMSEQFLLIEYMFAIGLLRVLQYSRLYESLEIQMMWLRSNYM